MRLSQAIEKIKQVEIPLIKSDISANFKDVMEMFKMEGFTANIDLMRSTYLCKTTYEEFIFEIYTN